MLHRITSVTVRYGRVVACAGVFAFVLAAAVVLNGCGGDGDALARCGNDVLDADEECDDGNLLDDDDCLSTCVVAQCGDGFAAAFGPTAAEECDGVVFPSVCSASLPEIIFCRQAGDCPAVPGRPAVCAGVVIGGVPRCASLGLGSGELRCTDTCTRDTSACIVLTPTPTRPPATPTVRPTRTPAGS